MPGAACTRQRMAVPEEMRPILSLPSREQITRTPVKISAKAAPLAVADFRPSFSLE
jgi:hypothetical protein